MLRSILILGYLVPVFFSLQLAAQTAEQKQVLAGNMPPSYQRDVRPVLNQHCLSCHGLNSTNGDLTTYEEVFFRREDIYMRTVKAKDMPPKPHIMADFERRLLELWYLAGSPE